MNHQPIVVGVDGSSWSEAALEWAMVEARRRTAPVVVLHAFEWPMMGVPLSGVPSGYDPRQAARVMLLGATERARTRAPGVEVTSRLENGPPARLLLAESRRAGLLVLGSRGLGGFAGLLAGSVATTVAEHASCPVVVVRGDGAYRTDGPVLAGVDGPAADAAIGWAFDAAALYSVPLLAVHAWPPGPARVPDLSDPDEEEAAIRTYEQIGRWQQKYPRVRLDQLDVRGHPGAVLAEQSVGAQLAVVGARGRGGFARLLLGSTSQALLRHAHCPVVVVRES